MTDEEKDIFDKGGMNVRGLRENVDKEIEIVYEEKQ